MDEDGGRPRLSPPALAGPRERGLAPWCEFDGDRHASGLRDAAGEVRTACLWRRLRREHRADRGELSGELLKVGDPLGDLCLLLRDELLPRSWAAPQLAPAQTGSREVICSQLSPIRRARVMKSSWLAASWS